MNDLGECPPHKNIRCPLGYPLQHPHSFTTAVGAFSSIPLAKTAFNAYIIKR